MFTINTGMSPSQQYMPQQNQQVPNTWAGNYGAGGFNHNIGTAGVLPGGGMWGGGMQPVGSPGGASAVNGGNFGGSFSQLLQSMPQNQNSGIGAGGGGQQQQQATNTGPQPGNQLLGPQYTGGLYNLAGVAGNLGTMAGMLAPSATGFLQGLFSSDLNPMEKSFMNAAQQNQSKLMEQAMTRAEGQFENMPGHSSLPQVQREVLNDANNQMTQQASQLALQRQQLATGAAQFPFEYALNAANVAAQSGERMFNMANTAQNAYTNLPLAMYSQLPVAAPTVVSSGGGGGGGKGLF